MPDDTALQWAEDYNQILDGLTTAGGDSIAATEKILDLAVESKTLSDPKGFLQDFSHDLAGISDALTVLSIAEDLRSIDDAWEHGNTADVAAEVYGLFVDLCFVFLEYRFTGPISQAALASSQSAFDGAIKIPAENEVKYLVNSALGVDSMSETTFGFTGETGADISGGGGGSILIGGLGADTLTGGAGADSLSGEDGNDLLIGKAGIDYLEGGTGSDLLVGGKDGDFYSIGIGQGHDIIDDQGGNGSSVSSSYLDTIRFYSGYTYIRPDWTWFHKSADGKTSLYKPQALMEAFLLTLISEILEQQPTKLSVSTYTLETVLSRTQYILGIWLPYGTG